MPSDARLVTALVSGALLLSGPPGCSAASAPPPSASSDGATCAPSTVIAAASDYRSSELCTVSLDGSVTPYANGALGSDPALASSAGRLFWIDRYVGDVIELDPRCGTAISQPWPTGDSNTAGSFDPQDVAVDPATGNVWVARFQVSTVLVKTSDGSTNLYTVDLSGVAGVNRNPYMSSIRIIDGKAYVALEMLDPYPMSVQPSYLARIDVATRTIDGELRLKGRNPFGLMVEVPGALYLAEPGDVDAANEMDAGIERVDLATFTSELVVRESDIGASVDQISVSGGCGAAIVMGPQSGYNPTTLIGFALDGGALATPLSRGLLYTDAGFDLAGLAWLDGGKTLVGDRAAVNGKGYAVHAVTTSASCALTLAPETLYLPEPPVAFVPTR
jgi:hypothetical protein